VALAACADVVSCTGIPIIAAQGVVDVQTPRHAITGIVSTRILVITIEQHSPHADATIAVVVNGA
jgi:hypothetical protein